MTEQLDNKLIQRIIHAPSLWDNNFPKFHDTFSIAKGTIDSVAFQKAIQGSAHSTEYHNRYKKELSHISQSVQQSAKFKFNNDVAESVEEKDYETVLKELNAFLPFQKCYLEVRDDNANLTSSYLLEDVTESFGAVVDITVPKKNFLGRTKYVPLQLEENTIIVRATCFFAIDDRPDEVSVIPCPMIVPVSNTKNYNSYAFEYGNAFTSYFHEDNKFLNNIAYMIVDNIRYLQVLLSYPSLATSNVITGRKSIPYNKLGKFKTSLMNALPKWEHKVLSVDMYSNGSSGGGNGQGSGKRFHAVRKHLRRLASGKSVFVKPHFRGDKSIGVIDKDYLIKGEK